MALKVRMVTYRVRMLPLTSDSRFNYEAALVGLLGVIWLKRSSRLQYASHAHLNQLRIEHCMQIVGDAMAVLQHCATREPVVGVSTRNINHLREILQSL